MQRTFDALKRDLVGAEITPIAPIAPVTEPESTETQTGPGTGTAGQQASGDAAAQVGPSQSSGPNV